MNSSLIRSLGLMALAGTMVACTNQAPPPVSVASQEPPAVSPSPTPDPTIYLQDSFEGNALNTSVWSAFQQTGLILVREGRLEVLGTGRRPNYPYIVTKNRVFPESGPLYLELTYEIMAAGAGVTLALDYVPAPAPGEAALTEPFMIARDFYADLRMFFKTETGDVIVTCANGYKPGAKHTLRVEYDGATAYRVILDGVEVGTFTSKRRPQKFWIGNYPVRDTNPTADWPHFAFDQITAGQLTAPAQAVPTQSPSPTPTPSPSASP